MFRSCHFHVPMWDYFAVSIICLPASFAGGLSRFCAARGGKWEAFSVSHDSSTLFSVIGFSTLSPSPCIYYAVYETSWRLVMFFLFLGAAWEGGSSLSLFFCFRLRELKTRTRIDLWQLLVKWLTFFKHENYFFGKRILAATESA